MLSEIVHRDRKYFCLLDKKSCGLFPIVSPIIVKMSNNNYYNRPKKSFLWDFACDHNENDALNICKFYRCHVKIYRSNLLLQRERKKMKEDKIKQFSDYSAEQQKEIHKEIIQDIDQYRKLPLYEKSITEWKERDRDKFLMRYNNEKMQALGYKYYDPEARKTYVMNKPFGTEKDEEDDEEEEEVEEGVEEEEESGTEIDQEEQEQRHEPEKEHPNGDNINNNDLQVNESESLAVYTESEGFPEDFENGEIFSSSKFG